MVVNDTADKDYISKYFKALKARSFQCFAAIRIYDADQGFGTLSLVFNQNGLQFHIKL